MRNLIDYYLLALRHEAHRSFPADRAEEIFTEVQMHLEDRVESNVRDGISRPVAEADALNDFGPVRKLLRGFLDAAYESPFARRVRLVAFWLVVVVAVILAFCHLGTTPEQFARRYPTPLPDWFPYVATFGMIVVVIGGLLGRRPQTKQYALVWCAVGFLIVLQVGSNVANLRHAVSGAKEEWTIPMTIHRNQLSREMQISQKHLEQAEKEVRLLEMGLQTFTQTQWKDVPEEFKEGDRYLLPAKGTPGLRRSAFTKTSSYWVYTTRRPNPHYSYMPRPFTKLSKTEVIRLRAIKTQLSNMNLQMRTMSQENIRSAWVKAGPRWLIAKRKAIEREKWLLGAYASIEQSPGFNMGAVVQRIPLWSFPAIGWLALLLGADFIAASVGRFLHRLRREWEWRITAARVR